MTILKDFIDALDQNKIELTILQRRYYTLIKGKKKDVFWNIKIAAEVDKRFKTKSGSFFQNEAGDIKLKFKGELPTFFCYTIKQSYHIGITHVNDVELVVAYAMLRANPDWETKLEKEIGQPFYGKEKLIWRPTEGFGIRYVRKKGSKTEMPLEDAHLGKFYKDELAKTSD